MARFRAQPTSLLRNADFVRLWAGQSVSELGSSVSQLAIPLVAVLTLHTGPLGVGGLNAVQMAPFLALTLPAGAMVDWMHRRRVLVTADAGRLLTLASIPVAAAFGALTLAQLYAVALVSGVLTVFFDVAYQSYLPVVVERGQLAEGNSRLGATQSAAQIAGPPLGGVLVGAFGAATAVAADAASYLVSVVSLLAIRTPDVEPAPRNGRFLVAIRRDMREGLRYVLRHRTLRLVAACTGWSNLCSSIMAAVETLYLVRVLHLHASTIGLFFGIGSVAGLVGAVTAGRLGRWFGLGRATVGAVALGQLGAIIFPLTRPGWSVWLFPVGFAFFSFGAVVYNIGQVSYRQAITPSRLMGRMNATMRFLVWGTMPIGSVLGGVLGSAFGLRATLWVAGIGALLAAVPVLLSPLPGVRTLDGIEVEDVTGPDELPVSPVIGGPATAAPESPA